MMNNTAAIESLRTFALTHGELQFAHLCTAALHRCDATWEAASACAANATGHPAGCDCTECSLIREESVYADDAWALDRLTETGLLARGFGWTEQSRLDAIRATDTSRPDGAIARSIEI